MIYEYPERFIVPIVYVKVVEEDEIYRNKKHKFLDNNKLLVFDEELHEDEKIKSQINIYADLNDKDTNIFNMEWDPNESFLQEPTKEIKVFGNNLDNEYISEVLSEIDNDYANNEILNM